MQPDTSAEQVSLPSTPKLHTQLTRCRSSIRNSTVETSKMSQHTILLVQPGKKPEGRTYSDYESLNECLEGVCKIFEEYLKKKNPHVPSITYDISELFSFIDSLSDLSCLVYSQSTNTYVPKNKDYIKEQIYILLRKQAGHT